MVGSVLDQIDHPAAKRIRTKLDDPRAVYREPAATRATERAGTAPAGTERAGTERAGTERAGTEPIGTETGDAVELA
jgi:hypothetical protein